MYCTSYDLVLLYVLDAINFFSNMPFVSIFSFALPLYMLFCLLVLYWINILNSRVVPSSCSFISANVRRLLFVGFS